MSWLMGLHAWVGIDLISSVIRGLCQECVLEMPDLCGMQNVPSATAPVFLAV